MSQQLFGVINNSSGSFEPDRNTLNRDELMQIYNSLPWGLFLNNYDTKKDRINHLYGGTSSLGLIKALLLPFLINIPTERALGRNLEDQAPLQALCGFAQGEVPSRGTLWNFRRKHIEVYPELLLRILILMVINDDKARLDLPFVTPVTDDEIPKNDTEYSSFYYTPFKITEKKLDAGNGKQIELWRTKSDKLIAGNKGIDEEKHQKLIKARKDNNHDEYKRIANDITVELEKKWLSADLGLPVYVQVAEKGHEVITFSICKPDWLETQARVGDTITRLGAGSFVPYIACNIIVVQDVQNQNKILLAKRQDGWGQGTYTLPGGKLRPDEFMEEGAYRELFDETGLKFSKSRPVSIQRTHFPGKPWALSVGILVEKYSGNLSTREPEQHQAWQWFDIDNLPGPLFGPTQIAISHYLEGTYPNLKWEDVEAQQAQQPKQITMDL